MRGLKYKYIKEYIKCDWPKYLKRLEIVKLGKKVKPSYIFLSERQFKQKGILRYKKRS